MANIKITTNFPEWPLKRQLPKFGKEENENVFFINEKVDNCDYWVVYEGLMKEESVKCPRGNTIFICGEPNSVKKYNKKFLNQFGLVVTSQKK